MVHVRVDEKIKIQAAETLSSMGLTVSDAVRVFLTRVVADKALPFTLQAPNETSRAAIAEADQIVQSRRARFTTADALLNGLEEASLK
jgi:DNA-damage-inducible protein J